MNPEGDRELPAQKIVQFLMTSGVQPVELKKIWEVAARTSNAFLLKDEFYVILRLVAYL